MSRPLLTTRQLALPLAIGLAMPMGAMAQTTGTTTGVTSTTSQSGSTSSGKLVSSYAAWAGSTANAQSLVNGLSTGTTVSLTGSAGTTGTTTGTTGTTSFSPSTGKLGVGETGIALSLAKASLAQQGITKPTPAQISAALNGGMITSSTGTMSVPGVLSQRASGMGWGQIAQAMGVKLGAVVSASKNDKTKAGDAGKKGHDKDHKRGEREHEHEKESHGKKSGEHGGGRESHGGGGEHGGGHGGEGGHGGGKK